MYLLSLYLSVKRSHHVRWEGLEIPTLIQKEKDIHHWILWRSEGLGLIQRIHKFRIKIRKSKESIFNKNTIIDKFVIKNKKNSR
jgi:hypothetical protein